jgi:murein DD-endopeptidase MepM/ murein hydrolase activator NlpD
MKVRGSVLTVIVVAVAFAALGASFYVRRSAEQRFTEQASLAVQIPPQPPPLEREVTSDLVVSSGSSFDELLRGLDLADGDVTAVIQAAKPVFNFRRLREGNRITVKRSSKGDVESMLCEVDRDHELSILREIDGTYKAELRELPSTTKVEAIAGTLNSSLFESVADIGEQPELALRLAEIFAYDLDFYTDPRPGDTFRVLLERRKYENGQPAAYGRILMAEYVNAGHTYRAVLFHDTNGEPAYYSDTGQSLAKAFLRSPLKFAARVSSHFSYNRYHPVLKIYRPHLGTDYAAPVGTPVQAIANGSVVMSGYQSGGGNYVEIRHSNGYISYYMHLSRRLVRTGQKVRQGQRIGLVGATGLATGPHLDFRLRRNGQFVNFEHMKLPPAFPVAKKDMPDFNEQRDKWMPLMAAAQAPQQHPQATATATASATK